MMSGGPDQCLQCLTAKIMIMSRGWTSFGQCVRTLHRTSRAQLPKALDKMTHRTLPQLRLDHCHRNLRSVTQ
jgi:hypothetical protein